MESNGIDGRTDGRTDTRSKKKAKSLLHIMTKCQCTHTYRATFTDV